MQLAKSILGGEVYSLGKMLGRISMVQGIYAHFINYSPGMVGLEDCGSLLARLEDNKIITENCSIRHFLAIQQALETQELGNVYWLPGLETRRMLWRKPRVMWLHLSVSWDRVRQILAPSAL